MSTVDSRSSDVPVDAEQQDPIRTRRRLWRRLGWTAVVLVLLGVGAFVVASESLSLIRHAKRAQAALEQFKVHLQATDDVAARADLVTAAAELKAARGRYNSFALEFTRHIPVIGWPISDAGHLLNAATSVQSAGTDALGLYEQVRGSDSKLFRNERVSLPELNKVVGDADGMVTKMDHAAAELRRVHAAFWEPSVGSARAKALQQVTKLRAEGVQAQRLLRLAPGLVGAHGPRTYLVAVLNPAELEGAGGAALNLTAVRFTNGAMKILSSGATSDLTSDNQLSPFRALPEDPWLHGRGHQLGSADRSPDFRTSGAELMRGFTAQFRIRVDGIIALDPLALQALMSQLPALTTPGYGTVTSANIVQTLLVDSYLKFPLDPRVRHAYNEALMRALIHQGLSGGHLLGKARALRAAAQQGHIQILMNDPAVQQEVAGANLLRVLPPPGQGDVIGVYTSNGNASKVDVWQQRRVSQHVTVKPDGSVDVVRTVYLKNAAPPYPLNGADPGIGYFTRVAYPKVTLYVPPDAAIHSLARDGQKVTAARFQERGLDVLQMVKFRLDRGVSATIVLRYSLPPGAAAAGYRLAVASQPTVLPVPLTVSVTGPAACTGRGAGWTSADGQAVYRSAFTPMFNTSVSCRS